MISISPDLSAMASTSFGDDSTVTTPDDSTDMASALMPAPEELPYFPEKYPGKLCILCNLGERSQLGQGEMLRLEVSTIDDDDNNKSLLPSPTFEEKNSSFDDEKAPTGLTSQQAINRRQKGVNKCK
jgi:hypothetical protein